MGDTIRFPSSIGVTPIFADNGSRIERPVAANDLVKPIHAKAVPVILTERSEFDTWLSAPPEDALQYTGAFQ